MNEEIFTVSILQDGETLWKQDFTLFPGRSKAYVTMPLDFTTKIYPLCVIKIERKEAIIP